MSGRLFSFVGGTDGPYEVRSVRTLVGPGLPDVARLRVVSGETPDEAGGWTLRGLTSHERYVTRAEKGRLVAVQPAIGRPEATAAALILIRKSAEWWALPQDDRRAIFEETSKHMQIGMDYLPAVARRLHHCRDLGEHEPFDFLTWFEFAPGAAIAFAELLARLRATEEWRYVSREVELRLVRTGDGV